MRAVEGALGKGASCFSASPGRDLRSPSCLDFVLSLQGAWERWAQWPQGGGARGTFLTPLSVIGSLGFPVTFEELRFAGSHIPGQVGQVARVFGQGCDVMSSGPILFGFSFFICCWPGGIVQLSVCLPCQDGLPGFCSPRERVLNAVFGGPVTPLLLCFIIFVILMCRLLRNPAVSVVTELRLGPGDG